MMTSLEDSLSVQGKRHRKRDTKFEGQRVRNALGKLRKYLFDNQLNKALLIYGESIYMDNLVHWVFRELQILVHRRKRRNVDFLHRKKTPFKKLELTTPSDFLVENNNRLTEYDDVWNFQLVRALQRWVAVWFKKSIEKEALNHYTNRACMLYLRKWLFFVR